MMMQQSKRSNNRTHQGLMSSNSRRRRRGGVSLTAAAAAAAIMPHAVTAFSTPPSFISLNRALCNHQYHHPSHQHHDSNNRPLSYGGCSATTMSMDDLVMLDNTNNNRKQQQLTAFYCGQDGNHNINRLLVQRPQHQRRLGSSSSSDGSILIRPFSTTTSLSVSRSSTNNNVLGFRIEDFDNDQPSSSDNNNNSNSNDDDDDELLSFSFEDFGEYQEENDVLKKKKSIKIRKHNTKLASSTSKRVAASLLKSNDRIIASGGETTSTTQPLSSSRSARPPSKSKALNNLAIPNISSDVPPWLPWIPTVQQIYQLKIFELRAALAERDLLPYGTNDELQSRLIIWSTIRDRKRVKDRVGGLKYLIERRKSKESSLFFDDDELMNMGEGKNNEDDDMDVLLMEGNVNGYNVNALRDKRMALTKDKKVSEQKKRGILGLVDESYFNTNENNNGTASMMDLEEEDDDDDEEGDELEGEEVNEASITRLSNTFNAPSSNYTNRQVRTMYLAAKSADQSGKRSKSKSILHKLRLATPHDMRIIRRLSRMEMEDGNIHKARQILQHGLSIEPNNTYLLHGMGQIERTAGNDYTAKKYYKRSIKNSPTFPNPYHALGTLEHTHGNIRSALNIIKEGIKHCPTNHRLYHALGDVYLDANMLDLAEETYLTGMEYGPHWSKSFFYTSLSYVSYARGYYNDCKTLLRQSIDINGGMHAQGVVALAQLEESEKNIDMARKVYRDAISQYEKKRRSRSGPYNNNNNRRRHGISRGDNGQTNNKKPALLDDDDDVSNVFDTSSLVDDQGNQYSQSYSGDKWINVFKSWARMEEIHGTYETTHIVYSKAVRLFPNNVSLLISWAELQTEHGVTDKARLLYEAACHRVGSRSAEPYRLYAEFEMKRKNYVEAQSILIRGAQAVMAGRIKKESSSSSSTNDDDDIFADNSSNGSSSSSSLEGGKNGLARLFHTWGVCEYHLGTYSRAEQLLDDALRVTGPEESDSAMRSLILYSMARLEYSRDEYLLSQHCIGLSLKENLLPGGNYLIWKLWARIAKTMGNDQLVTRCKEQAILRWREERGGTVSDLSRILGERRDAEYYGGRLPERTGTAMKDMFRKTPWFSKVCPPSGRMDKFFYSGAKLWA